ncbi:hydrogenase maturation nickel metallochaperone HypA [Rhodobacter sp. TJ_12]|uniref:hydrogenase maturation nickel metallochaperone HypA n=1 Tax=Rhodobacter sp. TJ_12 TaxID=2029399 RepID=UPI001CC0B59D|nr:hydrogenase maturation nickel metallochaperone HypA [Rhodobacter sp. TJ_12]MBZ4023093.1 hydrogenase maturation nickel metallochaperone HypA [Rhodobacter sp. TJ_12]
MHEMSIVEGIRSVIEEAGQTQGFARVTKVRLEIGRMSGVEIPALEFAFDVVMNGSLAQGATLEIINLPGKAVCFDCEENVEIEHRLDTCPRCGGARLLVQGGDEMRIKDLEVL